MMKKILFHGFYGFQNSGDDAFIEVCAWASQKYWETSQIIFLGLNLPQLISPCKSLINFNIKGSRHIQTLLLSKTADYFISAGGSIFNSFSKHSFQNIALMMKNTLNKDLKLGAIGVSIGPFKNKKDELNIINYLQNLNFLTVRDERSFNFAKSLDLKYIPIKAFDLAALLPYIYNFEKIIKNDQKKIIGISICNYERYVNGDLIIEKKRNQFLLDLISRIKLNSNYILRFFIFNGHPIFGDYNLTKSFITYIKDKRNIEIIPYLNDVKKIWYKVADCDVIISTRLHASIFACYANIPFFLVEYHQKCTDFLNDVGQLENYRIREGNYSVNIISEEINKILETGKFEKAKYIEQTKILAKKNFEEIII